MIRVPVSLSQNIAKVKKIIAIYYNKYGVNPDAQQIALESKLSLDEVDRVLANINGVFSYNDHVKNNGDSCDESELLDFIADDSCLETTIEDKLFSRKVKDILDKITILTSREKSVIMYRYGFVDNRIYTLKEIGDKLGITGERVRQIEARSLKKLAENTNLRHLNIERG